MKQLQSQIERADGPAAAQTSQGLELALQQEAHLPGHPQTQLVQRFAESEERATTPILAAPVPLRPLSLELVPNGSKDVPADKADNLDQFYASGGQANRSISAASTAYGTSIGRSSCLTEDLTQVAEVASGYCSPTPNNNTEYQLQHVTPTLSRRASTPLTDISYTPSTPARTAGKVIAVAASPGDFGTSRSETASPAQERKIFVGGVPQDFASEDLYDVFHEFGPIRKAWLQKCKPNQPGVGSNSAAAHNHRGFGFVVFQDRGSIDELLGANESIMMNLPTKFSGGKSIELKRAKSNNQMQQEATAGKQSPGPAAAAILEEPVTPQRAKRRQQVASQAKASAQTTKPQLEPGQQVASQAKASAQTTKPQLEPGQQSPVQTGSSTFSPSCARQLGDAADRDPASGYSLANSPVRTVGDLGFATVPVGTAYHSAAQQQLRPPLPQMQLYNAAGGQYPAGGCTMQVMPAQAVGFNRGSGAVASWPTAAMTRMAALPPVQTQPNLAATCAVGYRPVDDEQFGQPATSQSAAMWQQQWQGQMQHVQAIQPQPIPSQQYCFQREVQTPQLPAAQPEPEPDTIAQEDHRSGTPVPEPAGSRTQPNWAPPRGFLLGAAVLREASEQELTAAAAAVDHYED